MTNIHEWWERLSATQKRSALYLFGTCLSSAFNVATLSVVFRYLGEAEFGKYQFALACATTALLVGHLGTDGMTFREFTLPIRYATATLPRLLALRFTGTVLTLWVVSVFVARGAINVSLALFLAVAATATAESFVRVGSAWNRARFEPWTDFANITLRSIAVLALVFTILPHYPNAFGVAAAYGLGAIAILAGLFVQWRRPIRIGLKGRFDWNVVYRAAPWFLFLEITGNLLGTIPLLLLGSFSSAEQTGLYAIYAKYTGPFSMVAGAYISAVQPRMVQESHGSPIGVRISIKPRIPRAALAGAVGSALAFLAGALLLKFLGGLHQINFLLLGLHALTPLIFSLSAFTDAVLVSMRKENLSIFGHALGIAICAGLGIVVARLGAVPATLALLMGFSAKTVLSAWVAWRTMHIRSR